MSLRSALRRRLGEFAIVVFGVAAALAAENWRETQHERALAQDYLARLEAELAEGAPTVRYHATRVDSVLNWIAVLSDPRAGPESFSRTDSISYIINSAFFGFYPASLVLDLTYREMLATGSLNYVEDREIRDAITIYFRAAYRVGDAVDYQSRFGMREWPELVNAATTRSLQDLIRDHPGLALEEEEALLSVLREEASAERALRETQVGLSAVRTFLRPLAQETEALLGLLSRSPGTAF
jgi:hypothetical protein